MQTSKQDKCFYKLRSESHGFEGAGSYLYVHGTSHGWLFWVPKYGQMIAISPLLANEAFWSLFAYHMCSIKSSVKHIKRRCFLQDKFWFLQKFILFFPNSRRSTFPSITNLKVPWRQLKCFAPKRPAIPSSNPTPSRHSSLNTPSALDSSVPRRAVGHAAGPAGQMGGRRGPRHRHHRHDRGHSPGSKVPDNRPELGVMCVLLYIYVYICYVCICIYMYTAYIHFYSLFIFITGFFPVCWVRAKSTPNHGVQ